MQNIHDVHGISPRGLYASVLQEGLCCSVVVPAHLRDAHHEDCLDLLGGVLLTQDGRVSFTQDERLSVTGLHLETLVALQSHRDIVSACLGWWCDCLTIYSCVFLFLYPLSPAMLTVTVPPIVCFVLFI